MLRPAVADDLPRLLDIRDASGADALSDPALADAALLRRLIAGGAVTVWDDSGKVIGFAATDGAAIHLLVDRAARGEGVGRALLGWACDAIREAGHAAAIVTLAACGSAERHYLAAGWTEAGRSANGATVLKKPF
jgi:GNAT superfamily N-acetyltransferase